MENKDLLIKTIKKIKKKRSIRKVQNPVLQPGGVDSVTLSAELSTKDYSKNSEEVREVIRDIVEKL